MFQINPCLLGLLTFVIRNLDQKIPSNIWWLHDLYKDIKPNNIEGFLVTVAFDSIPADKIDLLYEVIIDDGVWWLTEDEYDYFHNRGFILKDGYIPSKIKEYCKLRNELREKVNSNV